MSYEYVPAGLGTQADIDQEAGIAAQTSAVTDGSQPFYVQHQSTLLLLGAAAVLGWYWWKKQEEKSLTENEGYYNLPEPVTPSRPSGL